MNINWTLFATLEVYTNSPIEHFVTTRNMLANSEMDFISRTLSLSCSSSSSLLLQATKLCTINLHSIPSHRHLMNKFTTSETTGEQIPNAGERRECECGRDGVKCGRNHFWHKDTLTSMILSVWICLNKANAHWMVDSHVSRKLQWKTIHKAFYHNLTSTHVHCGMWLLSSRNVNAIAFRYYFSINVLGFSWEFNVKNYH